MEDRDLAFRLVYADGINLRHLAHSLRADKEVVLVAVQNNGRALRYAHEYLKRDRDVVADALSNRGRLADVHEDLRDDEELVVLAIHQDPYNVVHASARMRADPQVHRLVIDYHAPLLAHLIDVADADVRRAVEASPATLMYAPDHIKADPEVVLPAVAKCPHGIQHASLQIRSDRSLMMRVVKRYGALLQYAAPGLLEDAGLVIAAVRRSHAAYEYVPAHLRVGLQERLFAVNPEIYRYLDLATRRDRNLVLRAVRHRAATFKHVPKDVVDKEIAVLAVSKLGMLLGSVPPALQKDPDVYLAAVADTHYATQLIPESLLRNKEAVLALVEVNGMALGYVDKTLRGDPEVVRRAVKRDLRAIRFASPALRRDRMLHLLAARTSDDALERLDDANAEITGLLARLDEVVDTVAAVAARYPEHTEVAEAVAARVHHPEGVVFHSVHKRGFEQAFLS